MYQNLTIFAYTVPRMSLARLKDFHNLIMFCFMCAQIYSDHELCSYTRTMIENLET